jgi:hypothetical protein
VYFVFVVVVYYHTFYLTLSFDPSIVMVCHKKWDIYEHPQFIFSDCEIYGQVKKKYVDRVIGLTYATGLLYDTEYMISYT